MHQDIQTDLHKQYFELVAQICAPEPMAYRWCEQVIGAALLWDHVVDGDAIDAERAHRTFEALTMDWIMNDWFYRNRLSLLPVMNGCVQAWRNNDKPGTDASYLIYTQIPAVLAMLIHGQSGERFLPAIHELMRRERFEDMRRDHPPFLIVGLPRSRTAWLAAFLTDGDVTCYHERLRACDKPADYPNELMACRTPIVGDADPSLPLFYENVRCNLPKHKVVFILRDESVCKESYGKSIIAAGYDPEVWMKQWDKVIDAFHRMRGLCPDAMTFRFDRLDDFNEIRQLTEYCTGLPFNAKRWEIFNELHITAEPAKVLANQRLLK